jgi:hypothetical protein
MKITGASSAKASGAARGAKPASGGGFSLDAAEGPAEAHGVGRASGVGALASVGALLALQAVEDPLQKRRRAVTRAGKILDALDALKIGLLEGGAASGDLDQLMRAVRDERAEQDDPGLQDLLNQIETRAAVELAKQGRPHAA